MAIYLVSYKAKRLTSYGKYHYFDGSTIVEHKAPSNKKEGIELHNAFYRAIEDLVSYKGVQIHILSASKLD